MTDNLRLALENAANGLLYGSESDHPFVFVRFVGDRRKVTELTATEVADLVGASGERASEMALERFLVQHTLEFDPDDAQSAALAPRYRALKALLQQRFTSLRIFRVGEVEIRVLALGNDPISGDISGLSTTALET